ncbi:MAG: hypothetical protein IPI43_12880 [Sandaracinaceae bacterium]|nr:hypothetical protein [Sandaracinaceae bacterium]
MSTFDHASIPDLPQARAGHRPHQRHRPRHRARSRARRYRDPGGPSPARCAEVEAALRAAGAPSPSA